MSEEPMPSREELDRAYRELMGERPGREVRDCLVWASEIAPEQVRWLWTGRIPAGTLSVFDGDPGKGKSTVTAELAAAVSTGRPLPGDSEIARGKVVLVSLEDDPATVIIPRLDAAGADRDNVAIFEIPTEHGLTRLPVLPNDLELLWQNVIRAEAKLVIIDPLLAVLSAEVNSDKGQDMGRVLAELVLLAKQTGAAVVVVRHLNKSVGKSAIYRGTGSTGIIGTARSGLVLTEHPGRRDELLLAGFKSNNGVRPKSLTLRIESAANGAGRIVWGEESEISADDALNGTAPGQESPAEHSEAEQWLLELLKEGPVPAKQIFHDAEECGFTREQIKRAKSKRRVGTRRTTGPDSHWRWFLAEEKGVGDQEGTPLTPFPPLGRLRTGFAGGAFSR